MALTYSWLTLHWNARWITVGPSREAIFGDGTGEFGPGLTMVTKKVQTI